MMEEGEKRIEEVRQHNSVLRTEEVQDIIDRMPQRTGRIIAFGVAVFAGLLVLSGFTIKYPESISGVVTITARQSPVRLTAPSSGRLHILFNSDEKIKEGEMIAYIESGTDINAFRYLDSILAFPPDVMGHELIKSEDFLVLGDLTIPFLTMLSRIKSYEMYKRENPFIPKLQHLKVQQERNEKQLIYLITQIEVQKESKNIQARNLYKDSLQYFQLKSINETEYLNRRENYLNALQSLNALIKEREQMRDIIRQTKADISQLIIEEREHTQDLTINLFTSYHEVKNQVNLWKQKYAFIAPYPGKIEMLSFWRESSFLKMGEEVFAVIPAENPVLAQVLIPSLGAGKVSPGQEVIIKLDDFPYQEFGSVNGTVTSVSMLSHVSDELNARQIVNTYQVVVELPDQLKTNYGGNLHFKHDIKGTAHIIVGKRKLIERLFDNLKYLANE